VAGARKWWKLTDPLPRRNLKESAGAGQLTVRNVDDAIAAALKERAARAGRSAEAEHRRILEEALAPKTGSDFFEEARTRRVRLRSGHPETADLLREDRDRPGP
jgi:plasmid stability protein